MEKAGKGGTKREFKRKVRSGCSSSDDSDEDFVLENEEIASEEEEDDDVVNSLDGYDSEESFQGSVEGGSKEEVFRKTSRTKRGRGSFQSAGGKISRRRKTIPCEEKDEDEDYVVDDDDEGVDENAGGKISRRRKTFSCEENVQNEDEDEDYVVDDDDEDVDVDEEYLDEDDDDDEEFTPEEEDDLVDEEEDFREEKNSNVKVGTRNLQKRRSAKGKRRRKKFRVLKKPSMLRRRLRKKQEFDLNDEDDADLLDSIPVCKEKSRSNKISQSRKRRRYVVESDSDFVCSRSSDFEYTISEEEREQVKEASRLFGDLKACLRNSSSTRRVQDNCDFSQRNHNIRKKGKEKAKEVEKEVGKQVCGICLSEEDKRRSRGTLNCCSHYFCFVCIMEWSKVESRCPLCKQRFQTITKHGRSTIGVDLRNMIIEVPMLDQVYQPTEEEIRSFVDPYEMVICTECHEGGDDGLMLLCDICDSPAHTYCVGLGRQVPEGNWYCDGCRPVALGSSGTPAHDPSYDHGTADNNTSDRAPSLMNLGESSGPMIESSPHLAFPQVIGNVPSPRYPAADGTTASPVSGSGAATLSVRRQIHRHIQNIISNRMVYTSGRSDVISATCLHNELMNSRVEQNREAATQNSSTQEFGMLQNFLMGGRQLAPNLPYPVPRDNGCVSSRQSQFGSQVIQDPTMATTDRPANLTLWPALSGTNLMPVNEQVLRYESRSGVGDRNLLVYGPGEESQFYAPKEQLQSMVKRHLISLSQDIHLGTDTFKDIARSSTHTILAACGCDHRRSEVQMVPLPAICTHTDRVAAGETSMMKGLCSSCFESFVRDVVKRILDTRLPQWLSLGL